MDWIWQQKLLNIKHKTAFTKKCKVAVHHNNDSLIID